MKEDILVVDDEKSIRFTFEKFLVREGYTVCTAKDYDEALERVAERDFDLIFADILLGGQTGIDLLQEMKNKNLTCPVVMITGAPDIETASDAVRLGAFDYIPKPVEKEALLHVTQLALKHKEVLDQNEKYRANLEAIFRSVKDAIITVDASQIVVETNDAARTLCGLAREAAVGKAIDSLARRCNGKCFSLLQEAIRTRKSMEAVHLECQHSDRPEQVVHMTTSPLMDKKSKFSGAVMVIHDNTELVAMEKNLKERRRFHNIIGQNKKMQDIYHLLEELADVQTTVLISGESGTGKELVAEALHYLGDRSSKPLVKVNCAALPENLLESELFGHVKGAFTGAERDKVGRFQRAHLGTLFLDEIGDLSPRMQLKLLRVLQEREFEMVGDSSPIQVDVRVVAATNHDLHKKVRIGEFREDLYYRLKVVEIDIPPLRDRKDDLPFLVSHFLQRFNLKFNKQIETVSNDVQKTIMDYAWPGNVRELENALEHAFVLCRQNTIMKAHLPPDLTDPSRSRSLTSQDGKSSDSQAVLEALEKAAWNKSEAARLLKVSRVTLYRKMDKYRIMKSGSAQTKL